MRPRIALLDASHDDPNTVRNFRRELHADLAEFQVVDGRLPATVDYDAVVVTGSRSSINDAEAWIDETRTYVREAIDCDIPTLGICWGHQVIADALGGTVESMGEYELGYRRVEHTGADLFDGIPERFTVFVTHQDAVTELPPGATLIAENDYGIHGFQVGTAFGVQSHPEYDVKTAEEVIRRKDLPSERIESVCAGITPEAFSEAAVAKRIFDNFGGVVRDAMGSEASV